MTRRSLLLVDGDAKSLRVLEVSLRKAGFTVSTAESGQAALQLLGSMRPDLVISDTDMPDMDGYEFCRQFKANPKWKDVPFIFLTGKTEIAHKIRGLELGVDDYLTKPIYIKEILTRVRILLQKHDRARFEQKKENNTRFAGQLSDMGVVDLIQTIEVSRKTGVIHFRADEKRQATMFFKEGKVIDAAAGHLQGEDAVYRLLTWSDGEFEALFRPVRRKAVISMSSQSLLMEGMRRLDEWGRLQEQLPPLSQKFQVVYDELWDRLAELPDDINQILRLFDTRRTLQEVIDSADIGDLEAVEVISKLYFEGIIVEVDQERGLKSGSYPVSDLVLQGRASADSVAEASASRAALKPSAAAALNPSAAAALKPSAAAALKPSAAAPGPAAATAQRLAALEQELQEATEKDATASLAFGNPSQTPSGDGDTLSGLLQEAITAATPVTQPNGKPEPKRSTAKGVAVAPLPTASSVDSEDTVPATDTPSQEAKRPKTQPMSKMTPKKELDAAAKLADQQAGSITSPVEDADIRALLADQEASSVTMPVVDAIAKAKTADEEATRKSEEDELKKQESAGQIHTLASGNLGSKEAASQPEESSDGEEYEADLDDLGEDASLESLAMGAAEVESTEPAKGGSEDSSKADPSNTAAASPDAASPDAAPETSAASEDDTDDVVVALPKKRPSRIGAITAEIDQTELLDDEPNASSPVLWYLIGAVAAGFLGFVAIKAIGGSDSSGDDQVAAITDTKPVLVAPSVFSPDAAASQGAGDARSAPVDAAVPAAAPVDAAVVASAPVDAAVVASAPVDAAVVASAPADARRVARPDPVPTLAQTQAEQIKDLQRQARRAKRQGDRAGAIIFLDEALAMKRSGTTLFMKAEILLSLGDSKAAHAVAKELVRVAPRRSQGWRIYGLSSYEVEDYAGARKGFGTYLELNPKARDRADVITILESM